MTNEQETKSKNEEKNEAKNEPEKMEKNDAIITYICHQVRENPLVWQKFPLTAKRMRGILSFVQLFAVQWHNEKLFEGEDFPLGTYADLEIVRALGDESTARKRLLASERDIILDVLHALQTVSTDGIYEKIECLTMDIEPLSHHEIKHLRAYAPYVSLVYAPAVGNNDRKLRIEVKLLSERAEEEEKKGRQSEEKEEKEFETEEKEKKE